MIVDSAAKPRPVWVSGVGTISCLGLGVRALWQAVLENRSGIENGLGRVDDQFLADAKSNNRILELTLIAAREAMQNAGWSRLEPGDGLILATTTGQILAWDKAYVEFTDKQISLEQFRAQFNRQPLGDWTRGVSERLGHSGPSTLLTSACSASTQALGLAAMWIRQGKVKRCLVGGAEVLCDLTTEGFRSLQLLSTERATPFDANRKGINLSEGAAFLCLEAEPSQPALAQISGFGFSTDGFHMTGPHPEGDGSYRAMRDAVAKAGLRPQDIDWVHAHGTGSQANDASEGVALSRLFTDQTPYVSSTKWLHGHALAASGALEIALVVTALNEGRILHTRGLKTPDPKIPVKHLTQDLAQPLKHVLKNTLGFGGANAAIVLSHVEDAR